MQTREKELPETGKVLMDEGLIEIEQLQRCLRECSGGEPVWATVIRMGLAPEDKVLEVLSRHFKVPCVFLKELNIEAEVIHRVPAKYASHYKFMPVSYAQASNTLAIAMDSPSDIRTIDELRLLLGTEIKILLSTPLQISEAIKKYYGVGAETVEKIISRHDVAEELSGDLFVAQDLESGLEEASMIRFVNQVISQSIKDRATDIHIEPYSDELRVRLRIDGVLYPLRVPEGIRYFQAPIVSRIKIMAGMNIGEKRQPQDGRIKIKAGEDDLDLRVSVLPTPFGEAVHIRVLSQRYFLELEKLGLAPQDMQIISTIIKKPHGIVFVTGPTGSGKSTTLYASLSSINTSQVKVITIEDPIEYQMKGIIQTQVNSTIGCDFAKGLRHLLRHDPDVMMIGEVRDHETAEIAIRAALTGHLVFSTLHTNDAAGAVTRLLDMGIEPFLVSSSVECLIAQRLVRTICPHCRVPAQNSTEILSLMGTDAKTGAVPVYEGKGCEHCRFTGFYGRTAIYELLVINERIREMILNRKSSQQIKKKAVEMGMRTLRQDGYAKVLSGITTYSEVLRVTQQEEVE